MVVRPIAAGLRLICPSNRGWEPAGTQPAGAAKSSDRPFSAWGMRAGSTRRPMRGRADVTRVEDMARWRPHVGRGDETKARSDGRRTFEQRHGDRVRPVG